jgi:hypothetical protein
MKTGSSVQNPTLSNLEIGVRTSLVRVKKTLKQQGLSEDRLSEISRMLRIVKARLRTSPNINAWTELEFIQTIEYYVKITGKATTIGSIELRQSIECIGVAVR